MNLFLVCLVYQTYLAHLHWMSTCEQNKRVDSLTTKYMALKKVISRIGLESMTFHMTKAQTR